MICIFKQANESWKRRIKNCSKDFFSVFVCGKSNNLYLCNAKSKMVDVAQQVRASDCGSEGRRFEPDLPPPLVTESSHLKK